MTTQTTIQADNSLTPQEASELGLHDREWNASLRILGRAPTEYEARILAFIWGEYYSKTETLSLSKLLGDPGETATSLPNSRSGFIDIGGGQSVVLAIADNTEDAALSPHMALPNLYDFLLANISLVGAKPFGFLNLLRLGGGENSDNLRILRRLVSGAAERSRRMSIPIIDFDTYFHSRFQRRYAVQAIGIGLVESESIPVRSTAAVGDMLIYIGEPTGKDLRRTPQQLEELRKLGEHPGAIGLPISSPETMFRICSAVREAVERGVVSDFSFLAKGGMVAGLFDLAKKSQLALSTDLNRIPTLDSSLGPRDVLFSESSSRVMLICSQASYKQLIEILSKWDLRPATVGEVVVGHGLKIAWQRTSLADIPIDRSFEAVPPHNYQILMYPPMLKRKPRHNIESASRELAEDESTLTQFPENGMGPNPAVSIDFDDDEFDYFEKVVETREIEEPKYLADTWIDLIGNSTLGSRKQLYSMFDRKMGSYLFDDRHDAHVMRLPKGSDEESKNRALAVCVSSPTLYTSNDFYMGSVHAVGQSLARLASVGARALAVGAYLHVGDPQRYKDLCHYTEALRGIGDATAHWQIPIIANETVLVKGAKSYDFLPVPAVVMIGVIDDRTKVTPCTFGSSGDVVLLLGETQNEIDCSEYAAYCFHKQRGRVPELDFDFHKTITDTIRELSREQLLSSSRYCSGGGVAAAISQCCLGPERPVGAKLSMEVTLTAEEYRPDIMLFSETASRYLISCAPENEEKIVDLCTERNIPITARGEVGGKQMVLSEAVRVRIPLATAFKVWAHGAREELDI